MIEVALVKRIFLIIMLVTSISISIHASTIEDKEKACTNGDMKKCFILGNIYENGYGIRQDSLKAKNFYAKACNGGVSLGCDCLWILGNILRWKHENPKVKTKKNCRDHIRYYQKRCKERHAASCTALGMMYSRRLKANERDDLVHRYFVKACYLDDGDGNACYYLANKYVQGRELSELDGQTISIYNKACELGNKSACSKIKQIQE